MSFRHGMRRAGLAKGGGAPPVYPVGTIILHDTFATPSKVSIQGRSPDTVDLASTTWGIFYGSHLMAMNLVGANSPTADLVMYVVPTGNASHDIVYPNGHGSSFCAIETNQYDYGITLRHTYTSHNYSGFIFRYKDGNNFWAWLRKMGNNLSEWFLFECVNGIVTSFGLKFTGIYSEGVSAGQYHMSTMKIVGSWLYFYQNRALTDTPYYSLDLSTLPAAVNVTGESNDAKGVGYVSARYSWATTAAPPSYADYLIVTSV